MMTEQEHSNVQWRKVKLGEVGEIISGGTPSTTNETFWDGDVLFVTPLDLGRKNKIDSTLRTISELGVKNSSANRIKAHSLAISTRAPIGLMSIVNQDFTTNQGCKSIQFYDSYDSKFFYYYLSYNVEKIQRYGQGTTFMEISKTDFSNLEFTVPDLSAQRRIASILASADKVIAATQKTIAKYKQMKQGMMEDLLKPKEGWKMVKLGEVYNFQYGDGNKNPNNNGDYPIYGANGIIGGYTKFNAVDSVVIGHMGEYAGSVIWANGKHFVTYNGTITIVKDNNSLYDRFGYFVLLNLDIKKICAGSGQPFLSYDTLNKIEISIPDLAEQRRIASILSGIDAKIEAEEKVLEKYEKVKKGLMERLLNE